MHDREVDVDLEGAVEVVGQHVHGDVADDVAELSIGEPGAVGGVDVAVADATVGLHDGVGERQHSRAARIRRLESTGPLDFVGVQGGVEVLTSNAPCSATVIATPVPPAKICKGAAADDVGDARVTSSAMRCAEGDLTVGIPGRDEQRSF